MPIIQGTVSNYLQEAVLTGHTGGSNHPVRFSTVYVATFYVDKIPVRFSSGQPPFIRNGEQLVVAGEHKAGGYFQGYLFRNLSSGAYDNGVLHKQRLGGGIVALILAIIGGCMLANFAVWPTDKGWFFSLGVLISLLVAVGVWGIQTGLATWRLIEQVSRVK